MRFKVNNKYVVDAKSHDDAIRVVKMLDAMETYSIRWIDTYAKSQGYGPDFWRYDAEIKANNVKEALEKLAKKVALGGTGTANCLVMHVSNSHATYQFSGRLSELLKKTKEQLGDSVKDEASPLQIVNALLEDEHAAVDAYNVAVENLKGKIPEESYAVIKAIRNDENRHIENLQAVVNGNVTEKNLEDSVKDDTVMFPGSKLRKVAIKYGFLENEKLAKKIAADPEWQAIIEKYKDPLWSAPSVIDKIVKKYK
jgi:rubrerythrin